MGAGRAMSNRYVKTLFSRLHVTGERLQYTSAPICSSSHTPGCKLLPKADSAQTYT